MPPSGRASSASTGTACASGCRELGIEYVALREVAGRRRRDELRRRHRRPLHDAARRHLTRAVLRGRATCRPTRPRATTCCCGSWARPTRGRSTGSAARTSLTSKVAVVGPVASDPDADVDYLFLQLGVDEATVSDRQNCGNILAGVGPFAVERGLVAAGEARDRACGSGWSTPTASPSPRFPTPGGPGRVPRRRRDRRRPRHRRAGRPRVHRHRGLGDRRPAADRATSATPSTASRSPASTTACRWSLATARVLRADRLRGATSELAADAALLERIDAFRRKAGAADGPGRRRRRRRCPRRRCSPRRGDGGQVSTRSFIPVQPHTSIGVLAAVSVVTGMLLPGAVGHELTAALAGRPLAGRRRAPDRAPARRRRRRRSATPAAGASAPGVVRTARKLFDGTGLPRSLNRPDDARRPPGATAARHRPPRPRRAAHPELEREPRLLRRYLGLTRERLGRRLGVPARLGRLREHHDAAHRPQHGRHRPDEPAREPARRRCSAGSRPSRPPASGMGWQRRRPRLRPGVRLHRPRRPRDRRLLRDRVVPAAAATEAGAEEPGARPTPAAGSACGASTTSTTSASTSRRNRDFLRDTLGAR